MPGQAYRISLLDKSPVPEGGDAQEALDISVAYAELADRLGYHRIWFAEHHGAAALASSAPEILSAYALARTRHIRIGTGGVLLQHYSPFKVAEVFRTLSALAPGRVDLGIGKAPGGLPYGTRALQSELAPGGPRDFVQKLEELDAFLGDGLPEEHALHGARALPDAAVGPERILLGASPDSAALAARLGWSFTYAAHHDGNPAAIRAAIAAYEERSGRKPSLAVSAHVAPTQEEADRLVQKQTIFKVHLPNGQAVNLPNEEAAREYARQAGFDEFRLDEKQPSVIAGTPETVRAALDALHRSFGITEFVIDNPVAPHAERLGAIELLAATPAALAAAE